MKGRHLELKVSIYDELDLYNIQSRQPRHAPSSELCAEIVIEIQVPRVALPTIFKVRTDIRGKRFVVH